MSMPRLYFNFNVPWVSACTTFAGCACAGMDGPIVKVPMPNVRWPAGDVIMNLNCFEIFKWFLNGDFVHII